MLVPTYSPPSVAAGWTAQLVANGLLKPRSLLLDGSGALLVVERGRGVSRITFTDNGGTCMQVADKTVVVNEADVSQPAERWEVGFAVASQSADSLRS